MTRNQVIIAGLAGAIASILFFLKSDHFIRCLKICPQNYQPHEQQEQQQQPSTARNIPLFRRVTSDSSRNKTKSRTAKTNLSVTPEKRLRSSSLRSSSSMVKRNSLRSSSGAIALWSDFDSSSGANFDVIIVGGGVAAGYAAREFVQLGIRAEQIAIFSMESIAPYERSELTKDYLTDFQKLDDLYTCRTGNKSLQNRDWYESQGIRLFLQTEIVYFDSINLLIKDHLGRPYQASKCIIIATGSVPRKLPVTNIIQAQQNKETFISPDQSKAYKNLFYIRTIDDTQKLKSKLVTNIHENLVKIPTCLVIGGGYIGLECASAASLKGWLVTIIIRGDSLYSGLIPNELSKLFETYLTERGITLIKQSECETLLSDCGSVIGCRLKDKSIIRSDITIVGIGSVPNVQLFKGKLQFQSEVSNPGILVDQNFQTSCKGIFAVGDIAVPLFHAYAPFQLEHAEHARQSAVHVARYIMGVQVEMFHYHPNIGSQLFDVKWRFFGDNSGGFVRIFGDLETKLLTLWVWDDKVQGALIARGEKNDYEILERVTKIQKTISSKQLRDIENVEDVFLLLLKN